MLAQLVREVGNKALLSLLDGKGVRDRGADVVFAGGDDTVRGGDGVTVEVRGELNARKLYNFTEERDTCDILD